MPHVDIRYHGLLSARASRKRLVYLLQGCFFLFFLQSSLSFFLERSFRHGFESLVVRKAMEPTKVANQRENQGKLEAPVYTSVATGVVSIIVDVLQLYQV